MPLARIITRNPDDASAVHDYLARYGYQVEFADPSALNLPPADLEVNLERLPVEDGLRLASEWAEASGVDVHVAAGAVASSTHPEPTERPAEISSFVPLTFGHVETEAPEQPASRTELLRDTVHHATGFVADSLTETKEAVSQSFADLKHRFVRERPEPEEQTPVEPSMLERWNRALAERRAARQERKAREREAARLASEQRALREAQAASLAREMREQAAQRVARPAVVTGAAVRATQPAPAPRPTLRPVAERRLSPARRDEHGPDIAAEYWKGAFTGAAAVAIILMVAWATLGSTHPATSPSNSGQIKQDVPFGPVTMTPSSTQARPSAPVATQRPQAPAHAVTPAPKPVPVRTHTSRRATHSSGVAEDDVVVHHYGAPKPTAAATTATNNGVKRISDQ